VNNIAEFGCSEQPKKEQTIQIGQAAWQRLTGVQTWQDWLLVGDALITGRAEAMSTAHTNRPEGKLYNKEYGIWLEAHDFAAIDKGTRSRLLECIEHRAEIEAWRATLTTTQRLAFNHPVTILRRWRSKTAVPDQSAVAKVSHTAKLKASIAELEEQCFRLKRESEHGGGDLWSRNDTAKDIARVLFSQFSRSKAGAVAQELTNLTRKTTNAKSEPVDPMPDRVQ
jgi:hypothetical protein